MTTSESDGPVPPESVAGRYVLVELLDADARREVWRGHDDLASRPVAVTRYLDPTEEWRRSFDQRARALEALSDPGIATVLRHDANDEPAWLVSAWVDGETVATVAADVGLTVDDALAVIGQTAFALASAHAGAIGHGQVDADHVVIRPDGSVALIGFAVSSEATPNNDLAALAALARELIPIPVDDVARFVASLPTANDPYEIGRTALALAAAQRTAGGATAVDPATEPVDDRKAEPSRPWYSEEERKLVRNRLIALGTIVVIGGALLLRFITAGAGQATVPGVTGLPWPQAQHQLNEVGFRASETVTTGPVGSVGTVIAQDPPGGTRLEVGSVVHLTVATR